MAAANKRNRKGKARWSDEPELDCDVCAHRSGCDRATSGSFCTRFQSNEAKDRGIGPAEAWSLGEEDTIW